MRMSQKNANRLLGRETTDANDTRMSGPLNPGAAGIALLFACPPGVAGDPDGAVGPHGEAGRLDVTVIEVVWNVIRLTRISAVVIPPSAISAVPPSLPPAPR